MTDYRRWEKFDDEAALRNVDDRAKVEDFEGERAAALLQSKKESQIIQLNAQREAEILRSKAAVESLKAKGVGGRRARKTAVIDSTEPSKGEGTSNANAGADVRPEGSKSSDIGNVIEGGSIAPPSSSSSSPQLSTPSSNTPTVIPPPATTTTTTSATTEKSLAMNIADTMEIISKHLADLMEDVDLLRKYNSESKFADQKRGFECGLKILHGISSISSVKRQVAEMLRVSEKEGGGEIFGKKNENKNDNKNDDNYSSSNNNNTESSSSQSVVEGVDKAMGYLAAQTTAYLASCALNVGMYAVAIDVSRCRIKESIGKQGHPADATVWVTRGLGFAAIGNFYLAHIHCKRAKSLSPNYPGINEIIDYLSELEISSAFSLQRCKNFQFLVKKDIENVWRRYRNYYYYYYNYNPTLVSSSPALPIINLSNLQIQDIKKIIFLDESSTHQPIGRDSTPASAPSSSSSMASRKEGLHMMSEEYGHDDDDDDDESNVNTENQQFHAQQDDSLQAHVDDDDASIEYLLDLFISPSQSPEFNTSSLRTCAHNIFYEGQLLFLESLFLSAEIKYCVCLLLCDTATRLHSQEGCKLSSMQAACYFNIAICRLKRGKLGALTTYSHSATSSSLSSSSSSSSNISDISESRLRASDIASCNALQLCEKGLRIADSPAGRIRMSHILQAMFRYNEALQIVDSLIQTIKEEEERGGGGGGGEGGSVFACKDNKADEEKVKTQNETIVTGSQVYDPVDSLDKYFVSTYGKGHVFAQMFLPGPDEAPLPMLWNETTLDTEGIIPPPPSKVKDAWLHTLISQRNHILFLINRFGDRSLK